MTAIPKRLAKRPQFHGMPIPVTVKIRPDGVPDFTAIDWTEAARLVKARCCALCGGGMSGPVAFIGGPSSIEARLFRDGPMHGACAEYAAEVCPFVSGDHTRFRDGKSHELPKGRMGVMMVRDYSVLAEGYITTTAPISVKWVGQEVAA